MKNITLKILLLATVGVVFFLWYLLPPSADTSIVLNISKQLELKGAIAIKELPLVHDNWDTVCLTDRAKDVSDNQLASEFLDNFYIIMDASETKWWLVFRGNNKILKVLEFEKMDLHPVSFRVLNRFPENSRPDIQYCTTIQNAQLKKALSPYNRPYVYLTKARAVSFAVR